MNTETDTDSEDQAPTGGVATVGAPAPRAGRVARRQRAPESARPEADAEAPAETGASADTAAPASPPRRRRGVPVVGLLGGALAVAVAAAVAFGVAWAGDSGTLSTQQAVLASARRFVIDFTNLSPTTIDAHFAAIDAMATGTFATQERQLFSGSERQQLESAQAQAQGQVRTLGLESVAGGKATVDAIVDMTYYNRNFTAPQTDVLYLQIAMQSVAGQWKVANLTDLSPSSSGTSGTSGSTATTSPTTTAPGG